jgi:hypothetical protein
VLLDLARHVAAAVAGRAQQAVVLVTGSDPGGASSLQIITADLLLVG